MNTPVIKMGFALLAALGFALLSLPPTAQAASIEWQWVFDKNPNDNTNGKLTLYEIQTDTGKVLTIWSVRAGSGNGPNAYNACVTNEGWLPNGTYSITATFANHQGTVEGPAVELSDHKCSNGTFRTELFIHSSYPWSSSHYNSNGCIKVSNTGGPANATGNVETMYQLTVQHGVKTLVVETA